jgi:anhydro-N-acetylmuramic acid kinase
VKNSLYIGLMSGTSVDSLDAVLINFDHNDITIVGTHSLPISNEIRGCVHELALSGIDEISRMQFLDKAIAQLSCKAIKALCQKTNTAPNDISAIGSHGQTIRHQPQDSHNNGFSLQVGDPNIIAERTGITTVADFRRRDIAAGGHGAPLAPAFHQAAFQSTSCDRIILNTGGIANISYLPTTGKTIGYDTGPANGLMDSWTQKHLGKAYDKDGAWAKTGTPHPELLNHLLQHPFFSTPAPKSTGREDFNLPWLEDQLSAFSSLTTADIQATLLALTVESIAHEIDQLDPHKKAEAYVCGGGAHNTLLMQKLALKLEPRKVATTTALGISPDWIEAVAFAWLAKQTINKVSSNLPSVTGAKNEVILGGIYWGGN